MSQCLCDFLLQFICIDILSTCCRARQEQEFPLLEAADLRSRPPVSRGLDGVSNPVAILSVGAQRRRLDTGRAAPEIRRVPTGLMCSSDDCRCTSKSFATIRQLWFCERFRGVGRVRVGGGNWRPIDVTKDVGFVILFAKIFGFCQALFARSLRSG